MNLPAPRHVLLDRHEPRQFRRVECAVRSFRRIDCRDGAGQPVAGGDCGHIQLCHARFLAGERHARYIVPVGQKRAPRRRIGLSQRPLGKERLHQVELGPHLVAGDDLHADHGEAAVVALEAGEARLAAHAAGGGRRAVEGRRGDRHRIGRHVRRDLGTPAPEGIVRNAVRRRVEQTLVERADRHAAGIEIEPGRGAAAAHLQVGE